MNIPLAYESCTLCPRNCEIDRTKTRGFCKMGDTPVVARAALHMWEEPCLSGTQGSGTVFFVGCSLGCIYCQNRQIAQGKGGEPITEERLSQIFWELCNKGAHNINLVTPTHYVPSIIKAIDRVKQQGFPIPFVYNTSGYEKVETLRALEGRIDCYLTDYRYASQRFGKVYSRCEDYPEIAQAAIKEMVRQTGVPCYDPKGILTRGTVIRLLLLPGGVVDAKLRLKQMYDAHGEQVIYSLMSQYTPMPGVPNPLNRPVSEREYRSFVSYGESLGIQNAFVQTGEAVGESFIPHFGGEGVLP